MNEAKFQAKLREYAKLIVKIGANVQKGQRVRLQAGVDQVLLTQMVTEECYQAGASYVEVIWECGEINKMHYQYATAETLGAVPHWEEERFKQMLICRFAFSSTPPIRTSSLAFLRTCSPPFVRCVERSLKNTVTNLMESISG